MPVKALPLLVLLATLGCQKTEPPAETNKSDPDAKASKVDAIDPSLAEAVAAASVQGPAGGRGAPPAPVEGGPPADGVLAPGAADKEIARGALPKLTLGSEGASPKLQLGVGKSPAKMSGTIQIALQSDPRQGAIPILLNVSVEPKKAEGAKAGDAPVSLPVTVRITGAKIDAPSVPKELDAQLSKLKGSKVEYSMLPSGAGAGFRFDVTQGAPEEFKDVVRSLSDALALLTIPFPDKPLGAGAYFMVTSREDSQGMDLVTYRMVKVKQVTEAGATLDVSTKRYAASRAIDVPGLPPEIEKNVADLQASSEGSVEMGAGALLPAKGQVSSVLAAQIGGQDSKQRGMMQAQTRIQLDLK
jgi:hypothetical protein